MAFESSLRARRSLIWETRDISKYQKDSPVFSLMHTNWILQINPVYGTGRFSPTSYNIKLKNCSGISSFPQFEIVTFLIDRRSNAQMHCSKLTISSACEILFRASFDSTYEKLPGLKLYDDVAILCTFYPSTGLALSQQTIRGSSLRIRHSIVWKTGKPTMYENKESPMFNLIKDSKWKLELHLANNTQYRSSIYQICLRNSGGMQSFQPFDVETSLLDRKNFVQLWCSRLTVSSSSEVLYKASIDSIYEELPGLKISGEITIVCAFGASIGSSLNEKMENDIAVTTECSQAERKNTYPQGDIMECSSHSLPSFKFLPDFENLSEDFIYLLNHSIMTDIELRCGDEVIRAHKAILAARSTVFSEILKNEIVQNNSVIVEIKDIEPCVLRELLKYLYSGKTSAYLSEDMLCKLYTASDDYSVESLQKLCSSYMIKYLNADNYIKFLILFYSHNNPELIEAVAGFIREKPELLMSDTWIRFSSDFPKLANEIYQIHMKVMKISSVK